MYLNVTLSMVLPSFLVCFPGATTMLLRAFGFIFEYLFDLSS